MTQAKPPARCYQGVIPALIATCAADGIPNVTYLSQVFAIDATHVALSCQFFNKTKQNVLENPYASLELYDPVSFDAYKMDLRFEAIASHTGMLGVFKLISADVFEILACEKIEGFLEPAEIELGSRADAL